MNFRHGDLLRSYAWGQGINNLLAITLDPALTKNTALTTLTPTTYYAIKDHQNTVASGSGVWVDI